MFKWLPSGLRHLSILRSIIIAKGFIIFFPRSAQFLNVEYIKGFLRTLLDLAGSLTGLLKCYVCLNILG